MYKIFISNRIYLWYYEYGQTDNGSDKHLTTMLQIITKIVTYNVITMNEKSILSIKKGIFDYKKFQKRNISQTYQINLPVGTASLYS